MDSRAVSRFPRYLRHQLEAEAEDAAKVARIVGERRTRCRSRTRSQLELPRQGMPWRAQGLAGRRQGRWRLHGRDRPGEGATR
jgi:hypothetical protein